MTAVIEVEFTTTTFVAAVPPNVTAVAPVKFVPVMVTGVPPPRGPDVGLTAVTVGTAPVTTIDPADDVIESFTVPEHVTPSVFAQRVTVTENDEVRTGVAPVVPTTNVIAVVPVGTRTHCEETIDRPPGFVTTAVTDTFLVVPLCVTFAVKVALLPWVTGLGDWPVSVAALSDADAGCNATSSRNWAKSAATTRTMRAL